MWHGSQIWQKIAANRPPIQKIGVDLGDCSILLYLYKDLVAIDRSNEVSESVTVKSIQDMIETFSKKYKLPCIYYCMSPSLVDNSKGIFYRNYCWALYKDYSPPKYEFDKFKYDFTYLCGYPRPDKMLMLSALFENNLLENALWSCGSLPEDLSCKELKLPPLPRILDYDKQIKGRVACWKEINPEFYKFSRFSLVQETEMSEKVNRYTEKTYKCFRMKHPFIVAGNYQVLKLLRDDGFKTFHPYIDESYDNISDKFVRIAKIIEQVKILLNKSQEEWYKFYLEIEHILNYNYNHAVYLNKLYYNPHN